MPKLKKKTRTAIVYVYVKPANKAYFYKKAANSGMSYSVYLDLLLEKMRVKDAARAQ